MKITETKIFRDLDEIIKLESVSCTVFENEIENEAEFCFSFRIGDKYHYVIKMESCDYGVEITSIIYKEGIEIEKAFFTDVDSAYRIWCCTVFQELGERERNRK